MKLERVRRDMATRQVLIFECAHCKQLYKAPLGFQSEDIARNIELVTAYADLDVVGDYWCGMCAEFVIGRTKQ